MSKIDFQDELGNASKMSLGNQFSTISDTCIGVVQSWREPYPVVPSCFEGCKVFIDVI